MAEAAAHHEKMEDFVGTEVLMPAVKNRKFQCVDHTADGIDDAAGKEPHKSFSGQTVQNLGKCQNAGPSHSDIEHGGNPFRAVYPKSFQNDSKYSDAPHNGQKGITQSASDCNEANRCIGSGNEYGYHHMVKFF